MKIVLIGTTANCVIGFRADLIKSLHQQGHIVYAFALDYDDKSRKQVAALGATPVNYRFSRTGLNPIKDLYDTYTLSKQLKSIAPDLVFSYFSKPCIFGTLAAVLAGVKKRYAMLEGLGYLFTEQPQGVSWKVNLLKKTQTTLYRLIFPKLDALILLNPDDRNDLLVKSGIKVKRAHVLGGIGLKLTDYPFTPTPTEPVSFIFIARLLAEKGVHEYVTAAKAVKQRYPDVQFYMLGAVDKQNPGSLTENSLKKLIEDDVIIYPGHVSNVQEWIKKSSVFVLPSYYREGIPRSTQEAMAMGRAVLSTDVPGCRETVIHGVNGFLIQRWSPEELTARMIELIEDPAKIVEMGLASYQLAQQKFDAHEVNGRLLEMLEIPQDKMQN
ncbi:glycosyltransferase family 4 protein [Serratia liquefaciens]|jgi:glycosyltransferase involved in cell wall biosynthesis|uniref:glycosyltransferase family 4 protein n=1 Tax=Serratia liquefaciens TaxID=614 RepID=UPI00061B7553|nr:glycosyltransferase family 4 protein [Serratia liquefaciens]AKE11261.1 glycosyl transferase family 1 [Serratia liquefaciens]NWA19981.1 glycosyltransferase family 4 protein [Serratia liquefaciens]PVD45040.1 glycosyltransferase family 1 protein [Serratia liquefaciens]QHT50284.1 glycosyltransferase family 4 protein [Serratia liquefaciens]CAI1773067.1 Capsular glucan synthase [Serratia liquefaciens]